MARKLIWIVWMGLIAGVAQAQSSRITFSSGCEGDFDGVASHASCGSPVESVYRVVFSADDPDDMTNSDLDLWVMPLDGSEDPEKVGINEGTYGQYDDMDPVWCDDDLIAFARLSQAEGIYGVNIHRISTNGTHFTELTDTHDTSRYPSCTYDSSTIVYAEDNDDDGVFDIWTMNVNGTGHEQITDTTDSEEHPSWSPSGTRIAYATDQNGNWDVYSMTYEGEDQSQLTTDTDDDVEPHWGGATE